MVYFISRFYLSTSRRVRSYQPGAQRPPVPEIRYMQGWYPVLRVGFEQSVLFFHCVDERVPAQLAAVNHVRWGTKQH